MAKIPMRSISVESLGKNTYSYIIVDDTSLTVGDETLSFSKDDLLGPSIPKIRKITEVGLELLEILLLVAEIEVVSMHKNEIIIKILASTPRRTVEPKVIAAITLFFGKKEPPARPNP